MSLITFLALQISITIEAYGGVIQLSDLIRNIFICVAKMNESLTGLNDMSEKVNILGSNIPQSTAFVV